MCPQCSKPIQWKRTDVDGWVPCDETPVMFVKGGRMKLLKRRDLIEGCTIYVPGKHKGQRPQYAYMPHYYTCPVLRRERAEWAAAHRRFEQC